MKSLWRNSNGQDLLEYALMTAFVAVAAAAIVPDTAEAVRVIFEKVVAAMDGTVYVPHAHSNGWLRGGFAAGGAAILWVIVWRRAKQNSEL